MDRKCLSNCSLVLKGNLLRKCLWNGWRFMTLYSRQGSRLSPKKKKCKKAKWLPEEALQITVKRREVKAKKTRNDTLI